MREILLMSVIEYQPSPDVFPCAEHRAFLFKRQNEIDVISFLRTY